MSIKSGDKKGSSRPLLAMGILANGFTHVWRRIIHEGGPKRWDDFNRWMDTREVKWWDLIPC